jgi:Autographiviridae endonuclease VII
LPRANFSTGRKRCSKCKQEQPLCEYPPNKATWDGLTSWCRRCQSKLAKETRAANVEEARARGRANYPAWKKAYLFRTYGLTPEDVELIMASQADSCAACGCDLLTTKYRVHVDHDHGTGAVRAMLCHPCNSALGLLEDSPARVEALLVYIRRFKSE